MRTGGDDRSAAVSAEFAGGTKFNPVRLNVTVPANRRYKIPTLAHAFHPIGPNFGPAGLPLL